MFSSDLFSYDKTKKQFSCEASTMQIRGGQKEVHMVSAKTGVTKTFRLAWTDRHGEDIAGWYYIADGYKLLVIND